MGERVQTAWADAWSGQRQIQPFGFQTLCQRRIRKGLLPRLQQGFQFVFRRVEQLADLGALLRDDLAHILADLRQRAFAAENFHTHRFQFLGCVSFIDAPPGALRQLCK